MTEIIRRCKEVCITCDELHVDDTGWTVCRDGSLLGYMTYEGYVHENGRQPMWSGSHDSWFVPQKCERKDEISTLRMLREL